MKPLLVLALALILPACTNATRQPGNDPALPVALTQLGVSVDARTAQVDVHLTARSGFPRTLKTLRVFVALYDASGTQLGAEQVIEILGPIKQGQSIGPLDKITSIQDRSVQCAKVVRVEAVMMDYATRIASGQDAMALVSDPGFKACVATR